MKLDRILPFARILLEKAVRPGDITIDGTMGNGFDTAFLAGLTGVNGHVYSFDIQKEAIQTTAAKLNAENLQERCTLIHDGHEHISKYIRKEHSGKITGAIFNLGYLPMETNQSSPKPIRRYQPLNSCSNCWHLKASSSSSFTMVIRGIGRTGCIDGLCRELPSTKSPYPEIRVHQPSKQSAIHCRD